MKSVLLAIITLCIAGVVQAYAPPQAIPVFAVIPGGESETIFDIGDANYSGTFLVSADFAGLVPAATVPVFGTELISGTFSADGVTYELKKVSDRLQLSDVVVHDPMSMSFAIKAESFFFGGVVAGVVAFADVQGQIPSVSELEPWSMLIAGLMTLLSLNFRRKAVLRR